MYPTDVSIPSISTKLPRVMATPSSLFLAKQPVDKIAREAHVDTAKPPREVAEAVRGGGFEAPFKGEA